MKEENKAIFERLKEAELSIIKNHMDKFVCPDKNRQDDPAPDELETYLALSSIRDIGISAVAIEQCFKERDNGRK